MNYKNNPLNIRYSEKNNWRGQIEPKNGFCQFEEIEYGIRAAVITLNTYRRKGKNTIKKIIESWAPNNENDTQKYKDIVCKRTNIKENEILSTRTDYLLVINAMWRVEQGTITTEKDIEIIDNSIHKYLTLN